MRVIALVMVVLAPTLMGAATPWDPPPACATRSDVPALVACLSDRMPRRGDGYVPPDGEAQAAWRHVVRAMLLGACTDAVLAPPLHDVYRVVPFHDGEGGDHCVALEADASQRGWGSLLVRRDWTRDVSVQVVHPLADEDTEHQGAAVYAATGARTLVLAGAHGAATDATCDCQNKSVSDVAHTDASLVQVTVEELDRLDRLLRGDLVAVQFHGMAATTCDGVDVYVTDGTRTVPGNGSVLRAIEAKLEGPGVGWHVTTYGEEPGCRLHGSTNVQGRLLNGVAARDVCNQAASTPTGRFLHVEQAPGFRNGTAWAAAVEAAIPPRPRSGFVP